MFEKSNPQSDNPQPSIATSRNKLADPLPQGKPLNKKLVGGVPLLGLTTAAAYDANPEEPTESRATNPDRERNLELLLLGIGPFGDTADSPAKLKPPCTPGKDTMKSASPQPVTERLKAEENKGDKKRVRAEEISCDLPSKKSLRFDCSIESTRERGSSAKLHRKGTPYKHSRRQVEFE